MQFPFPSAYSQEHLGVPELRVPCQCWGPPNRRGDETGPGQGRRSPSPSPRRGSRTAPGRGRVTGAQRSGSCCSTTELGEAAERRKSLFPRAEPQPASPCGPGSTFPPVWGWLARGPGNPSGKALPGTALFRCLRHPKMPHRVQELRVWELLPPPQPGTALL